MRVNQRLAFEGIKEWPFPGPFAHFQPLARNALDRELNSASENELPILRPVDFTV